MEENYKDMPVKTDFKLWGRLIKRAFGYKKEAYGTVLGVTAISLIDATWPLLTKYGIDEVILGGRTSQLIPLGIANLILTALCGVFVYLFVRSAGMLENRISFGIREEAFSHLQELSFSYYDNMSVGHILSRMSSDTSRVSEMISWGSVDAVWSVMYVMACMVSLFIMDAGLALIALASIPVLGLISGFFQKRILKLQREVRHTNSQITSSYNEGISGAVTSKTLSREAANCREFDELTARMKSRSVKSAVLSAVFIPIVQLVGNLAVASVIYFGGNRAMVGTLEIGTFAAFISYVGQLFDPIQNLAGVFAELQGAQAAAERVLELLDTPLEIKDAPEVVEKYGDSFFPKKENWEPLEGDIEFKHVDFAYNNGQKVLEDFNLHVRAGESIALVGETGAGKSTIVNLTCRFYEPTGGEVLIDGKDYRERSSLWLEAHLGYVLQTPHLFSGSIADNIRYGRKDASDDEVKAAAKAVRADEFIEKLTNGYDTEVGEGGDLLSTGQKQLISFARVILANPSIIVLDEATSSIDTETEAMIQNAVNTVLKGRTSFIVAHRLSTIRNADRILVISGGKITEEGNHEQLMKLKGYYYKLYTNQFLRETEDASVVTASNNQN